MTVEELKEMVDATIRPNGAREITGKALNAALQAIVEAIGSMAGSAGSGLGVAYLKEVLSESEQAANKVVYDQVMEAATSGSVIPAYLIDVSELMGAPSSCVTSIVSYMEGEVAIQTPFAYFIVNADGTIGIPDE